MMTRTQIRQKIYLARIAGLLEPHIARFWAAFLKNALLRRCGRQSRWSSPPIKICGIDRANSVGGPRYLVYCLTPKTRRDILIQKKSFFFGSVNSQLDDFNNRNDHDVSVSDPMCVRIVIVTLVVS